MNKKFIIAQAAFVLIVLTLVFALYPKVSFSQEGDKISFKAIRGANGLIISENNDFSNARYVELNSSNEMALRLKPGKYYWKAESNYFESLKKEFVVDSTVALKLEKNEEETELENVGDVKINITKTDEGVYVGRIVLEPKESKKVEDKGTYEGRQSE